MDRCIESVGRRQPHVFATIGIVALAVRAQIRRERRVVRRHEALKASAPPVVRKPFVKMLSLSATGILCSSPRTSPEAGSRSSASASVSASGRAVMIAFRRDRHGYECTDSRRVLCDSAPPESRAPRRRRADTHVGATRRFTVIRGRRYTASHQQRDVRETYVMQRGRDRSSARCLRIARCRGHRDTGLRGIVDARRELERRSDGSSSHRPPQKFWCRYFVVSTRSGSTRTTM